MKIKDKLMISFDNILIASFSVVIVSPPEFLFVMLFEYRKSRYTFDNVSA